MVVVRRRDDGTEYVEVSEPPTEVDLWKLGQRPLSQVVVNSSALAGRRASLDWLTDVAAPELIVHGGQRRIPAIPPSALHRFVEINLYGRLAVPLDTTDLHSVVGLGVH